MHRANGKVFFQIYEKYKLTYSGPLRNTDRIDRKKSMPETTVGTLLKRIQREKSWYPINTAGHRQCRREACGVTDLNVLQEHHHQTRVS